MLYYTSTCERTQVRNALGAGSACPEARLIHMNEGKLAQNGVHLQDHEYKTVKLLLENGFDVELIPPSQIKGLRMPDIMMGGIPWEMKSPEGDGKKTIQNTMQNAAHQAGNIIIDLRRCKINEEKAIRGFEREFNLSKRVKRMKIITLEEKNLTFPRKRGSIIVQGVGLQWRYAVRHTIFFNN